MKKTALKTRTTEDRTNRVKFHPMPRFRAGDTASQRRLLLTSRLHEASYTEDPSKPVSDCQIVVSHISAVIQNDVHDASQAQCDSELDFVMTESLIDVDVNNIAVELSSPPPLHLAEVRGQARHSDVVVNEAGICVGLVA